MRKPHLDYARAMGIIVVVWVHLMVRMPRELRDALHPLTELLRTTSYIPIFFLVSGALAARYVRRKDVTLADCVRKYAKSILLPFYTLCGLFFLVNIAASLFLRGLPSPGEMLAAVALLKLDDSLPSGVLWFFGALFLFSVTTAAWRKLVWRNPWPLLVAALALNVFVSPLVKGVPYLALDRYTVDLVYYVFGFCLGDRIVSGERRWHLPLALFAAYALCKSAHTGLDRADALLYVLATGAGCLGTVELFKFLEPWSRTRLVAAFHYIGLNSIVIYVFHMPSFKLIQPILARLGLRGSWPGALLWLALGIAIPIVIGEVLTRFPRIYALLFARPPARECLCRIPD